MDRKRSSPNYNSNSRDKLAQNHLHAKCQIEDYQNKDGLSVGRIL